MYSSDRFLNANVIRQQKYVRSNEFLSLFVFVCIVYFKLIHKLNSLSIQLYRGAICPRISKTKAKPYKLLTLVLKAIFHTWHLRPWKQNIVSFAINTSKSDSDTIQYVWK